MNREPPTGRGRPRSRGGDREERPRQQPRQDQVEDSERHLKRALQLVDLDEVELVVEKLVAGGDGLGRYEGIPIFVPRSAPGDRLRVRLVERKLDYARGEIVEILEPGPDRRSPECPHFAVCGGCDLQHLGHEIQSELKAAAALEALARLGGIRDLPPSRVSVVSGEPWAYRVRTQVHVKGEGKDREWGYFARRSRELIPVRQCPVLVPELQSALLTLGRKLPEKPIGRVDLVAGEDGSLTASPPIPGIDHGEVSTSVGALSYSYDARCFFQGHRQLISRLVEASVGPWTGGLAWDLFSGVGLFTLPLAQRHGRVIAVESDPIAARYCRINARRNRIDNVEVISRDVSGWAPDGEDPPDRVVADPPRRGLPGSLVQLMQERPPKRLTYVSCHPATLARDLKALAPVLRLEGLVLLDMFPQTGHMEAVAHLQRI